MSVPLAEDYTPCIHTFYNKHAHADDLNNIALFQFVTLSHHLSHLKESSSVLNMSPEGILILFNTGCEVEN